MSDKCWEISDSENWLEVDGELHPNITFEIDAGRYHGILHVTEDVTLMYDVYDERWTGEGIGPDGWYDLNEEEINDLVDELGLEEPLQKALAAR